jgi:hypothetical protein
MELLALLPVGRPLKILVIAAIFLAAVMYSRLANQSWPCESKSERQNALLVHPPSTRNAAPVVPEDSGLAM